MLCKISRVLSIKGQNKVACGGNKSDGSTCRMVRQASQLWSDLHQGILTTGKLNACLGFYEPKAAKRLGIGADFVSHRALFSAYHHLLQDVYVPPVKVPGLPVINLPPVMQTWWELRQISTDLAKFVYNRSETLP